MAGGPGAMVLADAPLTTSTPVMVKMAPALLEPPITSRLSMSASSSSLLEARQQQARVVMRPPQGLPEMSLADMHIQQALLASQTRGNLKRPVRRHKPWLLLQSSLRIALNNSCLVYHPTFSRPCSHYMC